VTSFLRRRFTNSFERSNDIHAFKIEVMRKVREDELKRLEDEHRRAEETRIQQIDAQDWSEEIKSALKKRVVLVGMTLEQVKMAWGRPDDIRMYQSGNYFSVTYYYSGGRSVTFVNNVAQTVFQ